MTPSSPFLVKAAHAIQPAVGPAPIQFPRSLPVRACRVHEPNPHFRDDYRIAWIAVLRAARGWAIPHVTATYAVLGLHPEKVWPAIVERRKFLLGAAYFQNHEKVLGAQLPPKKPVRSVRLFVQRDWRAA